MGRTTALVVCTEVEFPVGFGTCGTVGNIRLTLSGEFVSRGPGEYLRAVSRRTSFGPGLFCAWAAGGTTSGLRVTGKDDGPGT